jgi:hypothetical protein
MKELMVSPYFGVALSIVAFWIGVKLNHKLKTPVCNPLIVAIVLIVGVLLVFDIPYDTYNVGGELINMFSCNGMPCSCNLYKAGYPEAVLAPDPGGMYGGIGGIHGKCIRDVQTVRTG